MKTTNLIQYSPEWWAFKAGKIGGTRFGQVISGRKNRLVYALAAETISGQADVSDYINDAIQFGLDNEPIAAELYSEQSGIVFQEVGAILSDHSEIHHASPDRLNINRGIVLEIKCTENRAIHVERFFEGPETGYMSQIKNYFTVSDSVKEVHWVSYCPNMVEKPLIVRIFKREQFEKEVPAWREKVAAIEETVKSMVQQFIF
jgi:hypothetical protein